MATENKLTIRYRETDNKAELDKEDQHLLSSAREAAMNAYAPYSGFRVGAALRLSSGRIVKGTNIENAAFPSGICAERSAIANAAISFPDDKPVSLAIVAYAGDKLTEDPVPPCGSCRQVIAEEEYRHSTNIRIILGGKNKTIIIDKGADLLPLQFSVNNLKLNSR